MCNPEVSKKERRESMTLDWPIWLTFILLISKSSLFLSIPTLLLFPDSLSLLLPLLFYRSISSIKQLSMSLRLTERFPTSQCLPWVRPWRKVEWLLGRSKRVRVSVLVMFCLKSWVIIGGFDSAMSSGKARQQREGATVTSFEKIWGKHSGRVGTQNRSDQTRFGSWHMFHHKEMVYCCNLSSARALRQCWRWSDLSFKNVDCSSASDEPPLLLHLVSIIYRRRIKLPWMLKLRMMEW